MKKSRDILKSIWGFDAFRPLQENIVDDAINGHDVLALLPTGGGKSVCFQVPGIAREGVCLVVSPLIALMQDQVDNLLKKGIAAASIVSGMSFKEIDITLDNACFGGIKFLYTSPERIQSKLFIERFKRMKVGLIVVDEAHCISEWGHDFRPSFREIHTLRQWHPETPIIALTATATAPVKEDIIKQLKLRNSRIHEASFYRSNLSYNAYEVINKLEAILNYCRTHENQTGIIYCQTRKQVKDLAKTLHGMQFKVGIYHGGMSKEDRSFMLKEWLEGRILIMIATNAFGMGIDKPNVRFVLHHDIPNSIEAYFQEAGRAGRDEKPAESLVFYEVLDLNKLRNTIEEKFPPLDRVKLIYRALCNYLKIAIGSGKGETYPLEIKKLTDTFGLTTSETYNSLKLLELNGDLNFSEGVFHPTKLMFIVGNRELYNFQLKYERFYPLTVSLVRSYPGIQDRFTVIHESVLCKALKLTESTLNAQLLELEKFGIIEVSWSTSLPTVTFMHERLPDDYLNLSHEIYKQRKELANEKVGSMIHFLQVDSCRSQYLLSYFNQSGEPCSKCDRCLSVKLSDDQLKIELLSLLKAPKNWSTLMLALNTGEQQLKSALRELLLEEKIIEANGVYSATE